MAAERHVAALARAVTDPDKDVRGFALMAITMLGSKAAAARAQVEAAMKDPDEWVRGWALAAQRQVGR